MKNSNRVEARKVITEMHRAIEAVTEVLIKHYEEHPDLIPNFPRSIPPMERLRILKELEKHL